MPGARGAQRTRLRPRTAAQMQRKLCSMDRDLATVMSTIENLRPRLRGEIFGPLPLVMEITDAAAVAAMERHMPFDDQLMFVCTVCALSAVAMAAAPARMLNVDANRGSRTRICCCMSWSIEQVCA